MKANRTPFYLVSLLVILSLLLGACSTATPTAVVTEAPSQPPTEAPAVVPPTEAPTEAAPTEAPAEAAPTEAPTEAAAPETASLTCAEPVKVGLITDVTGSLAIYGAHILRSFMLGMEYATGAPGSAGEKFDFAVAQENTFKLDNCEFQVFVRDDQGLPDTTATVARELIEVNDVDILVGTASSGGTATLQGIAAENQIPLIVAPAAANDITGANFNEYTFRVSRNNYQDAMNECAYLTKQYKTFVQIAPDYAFGRGSAAAFRDACTLDGGTFVMDDIFAPLDTTDFTPYIQKAMDSGAENLFLTWAGTGYVTLFQQLSDLGALEKMKVATGFGDNASFAAVFGSAVGTIGLNVYHWSVPTNPVNDWLVKRHVEEYKEYPDLFTAGGFASAIALAEGLKKTNGDASGDAMIPALEGLKFEGPKGTYYLRPEDHVAEQPMNILELVTLDPGKDENGINTYKFFKTVYVSEYNELGVPCTLAGDFASRCGSLPTIPAP